MKTLKPLPDYREIEIPLTVSSLKNFIEPLLYQLGFVRDDEEIISLQEIERLNNIVMIRVKLKRPQELEIIKY